MTAFSSRGNEDFIEHKGMVDIFNILATSDLERHLTLMDDKVKLFIIDELKRYDKSLDFQFALNGHFCKEDECRSSKIRSTFYKYIGI